MSQESVCFSDVLTMYETWDLLDQLDQRIELRFVMAGKHRTRYVYNKLHHNQPMCPYREDGIREMTVWRRPVNASNVIISGAGHLIVQEAPRELGKANCCPDILQLTLHRRHRYIEFLATQVRRIHGVQIMKD